MIDGFSLQFIHRPKLAEHIRTCSFKPSVAFAEARRFALEVREDWSSDNITAVRLLLLTPQTFLSTPLYYADGNRDIPQIHPTQGAQA